MENTHIERDENGHAEIKFFLPEIRIEGLSNPPLEEIMRISKEGFYYKGEKVEDIHNIYERFNEFLRSAGY